MFTLCDKRKKGKTCCLTFADLAEGEWYELTDRNDLGPRQKIGGAYGYAPTNDASYNKKPKSMGYLVEPSDCQPVRRLKVSQIITIEEEC